MIKSLLKKRCFLAVLLLLLVSSEGNAGAQEDLAGVASGLLSQRLENIVFGQSLITEDINENRIVAEIVQSSKSIEDDLNMLMLIAAAREAMETDKDRKVLEKIEGEIRETLLQKITHERRFWEKRLPLAKREKTRSIGQRLLTGLSHIEDILKIAEESPQPSAE